MAQVANTCGTDMAKLADAMANLPSGKNKLPKPVPKMEHDDGVAIYDFDPNATVPTSGNGDRYEKKIFLPYDMVLKTFSPKLDLITEDLFRNHFWSEILKNKYFDLRKSTKFISINFQIKSSKRVLFAFSNFYLKFDLNV